MTVALCMQMHGVEWGENGTDTILHAAGRHSMFRFIIDIRLFLWSSVNNITIDCNAESKGITANLLSSLIP